MREGSTPWLLSILPFFPSSEFYDFGRPIAQPGLACVLAVTIPVPGAGGLRFGKNGRDDG